MKILFACGGTAGHVNPALALAGIFREKHPDCEILFVGADGGMEERLVKQAGYEIRTVTITNLRRSFSLNAIKHNLKTVRNLNLSKKQSEEILAEFQPDLAVGTGGYASYSIIHAAARQGIPAAVHESNAVPGLTTKQLAKVVDKVFVGFEASRTHYPDTSKVAVTGTPVRGEFFRYSKAQAREILKIPAGQPVLLSYFGSLGADVMNYRMSEFLILEKNAGTPYYHVHGAARNYEKMQADLYDWDMKLEEYPSLSLHEYIYDMPLYMAAADVVICRAGASTIAELTAIGKPAILVPSPNVTANHQEKNARVLADAGAAVLLTEEEADTKRLYQTAAALLEDATRREAIRGNLLALNDGDPTERIYQLLLEIL